MDIQILDIEYKLMKADLYNENSAKTCFEMRGYIVTYCLNGTNKTIDISTDKELTIEEIKAKIKREPLATIKVELNEYDLKLLAQIREGLLLEGKEIESESFYDATSGDLAGKIFKIYAGTATTKQNENKSKAFYFTEELIKEIKTDSLKDNGLIQDKDNMVWHVGELKGLALQTLLDREPFIII